MSFSKFFMFFLVLYLVNFVIGLTSAADPTYLYHDCPNATTFSRDSTYQSNLNFFLSSLVSNATSSNGFSNGFYNATAGQVPNKVYGLFLCRGDVSPTTCRDCVSFATSDALRRCPVQKDTVIWYDECLFRYSNLSIFSTMDVSPGILMSNTNNVTEQVRFGQLLGSTMNDAATLAADCPKRFSTRKGNFTSLQTLYCLVQFTPDLSSLDCSSCLQQSIGGLPSTKVGGRILFPSCYSRFELYPFYNETATAAPAPPPVLSPPPPVSVTRSRGNRGISSSIIIAIVAPIVVAVVLFIAGCCLLIRRARKKSSPSREDNAGNDDITTLKSLQFDLRTIEVATNRFSSDNKLGEGGFGEVYKEIIQICKKIRSKPEIFYFKMKPSMIFGFLFLLSLLLRFSSAADPTYVYHFCSNTTTFSINSTYQSNLNLLLSSLPSNANSSNGFSNGFYNTTQGQDPDKVYSLFLCRGDVTTSDCQDCVRFATTDVTQRCPVEKQTVIWYDQCLLRYSNQSFFSIMSEAPSIRLLNTQNSTDQSRFNELVGNLTNEAAMEAINSPNMFATRKETFTSFQTVYSLVQCTKDLSSSDCNRCLEGAIAQLPGCCSGKVGGQVLYPSCYVRYEVYPFYNEKLTAAPAPTPVALSPPTPGSVTESQGNRGISTSIIIAIVVPIVVAVVLFITGYCLLIRRARKKHSPSREDNVGNDDITTVESLQCDLGTIEVATNKFSTDNKLGEGGFGEVYKGILPNGQAIAVKRLSRSSGQGAEEFKNEVVLVAKLQHRNLVRLLGFCLEGEEKILVYEFVTNKSLDYFLYDPERQAELDWSRRYKIIGGIARGILYLHEDSRLRIIHRDLKASNILLDNNMNPKISDFGMARIVGVDQTQANTNRIVGTYGYMAPEYAMHGQFSVKSDVYSFGVLVLEIITGKKNSNFYQTDGAVDLVSYAWKHWRDGTPLQLLDSNLTDSYSRNEVIRCIHMGLLCVQEDPADRPTMATIVLMLNSYSVTLPTPQKPAFFLGSGREATMPTKELDFDQSNSKSMPWSIDDASITEVYPR